MRIIYFIVLIFFALVWTPWLVAPAAFLYALRYTALELVVVAVLIDAFAGVLVSTPYYTIGTLVLVSLAESLKPYINLKDI